MDSTSDDMLPADEVVALIGKHRKEIDNQIARFRNVGDFDCLQAHVDSHLVTRRSIDSILQCPEPRRERRLLAISLNRLRDLSRKAITVRKNEDEARNRLYTMPNFDELLASADARGRFLTIIEACLSDPDDAEIFRLHYVEKKANGKCFTQREIGARLGKSKSWVGDRLARLIQRVRKALEDEDIQPNDF